MKRAIGCLFCSLFFFCASAQTYVPFGSYTSASGPFGQPYLRSQFTSNAFYAATSRFTVTAVTSGTMSLDGLFDGGYDTQSFIVPSGTSGTVTMDFTTKGNTGIVYPWGDIYLHFYYVKVPASVSGRFQKPDGNWVDLTWTNVSTQSNYAVWKGHAINNYNYASHLEITVNAGSGDASLCEIEFVMDRPEQYEPGVVTKFRNQTLYNSLTFKNSNNTAVSCIKSDGSAYFMGNLGIGTSSPTASLEVSGAVKFSALANNNSFSRILATDASGNLNWRDASTLGGSGGSNNWTVSGTNMFNTNSGYIILGGTSYTGTPDPDLRLAVNGNIYGKKIKVTQSGWADFVFERDYSLLPLDSLEAFIRVRKHLPEIPTAHDIETGGLDLGDTESLLLKKIEELTLYIIDQKKRLDILEKKLAEQSRLPCKALSSGQ